jgi:signal transduction histidine kinase
MEDLSLHILDVVGNSLRSGAKLVEISVVEDMDKDLLTLEIKDDGHGMDRETCRRAVNPFFTTKPGRRVGLGLSLLAQSAREADGEFNLSSVPDEGTHVTATFRRSHPDRRPLGDIAETLRALVAGHPDVDFVYEHRTGADVARLDTRELRQT